MRSGIGALRGAFNFKTRNKLEAHGRGKVDLKESDLNAVAYRMIDNVHDRKIVSTRILTN